MCLYQDVVSVSHFSQLEDQDVVARIFTAHKTDFREICKGGALLLELGPHRLVSFSKFGQAGVAPVWFFYLIYLLKLAQHAYQCTLWLPTENTLQNCIWWLVQVQNRYVHLSWVADPTNHERWVTLRFTYLVTGSAARIQCSGLTCMMFKYFYFK
jgi:hypothetical protein